MQHHVLVGSWRGGSAPQNLPETSAPSHQCGGPACHLQPNPWQQQQINNPLRGGHHGSAVLWGATGWLSRRENLPFPGLSCSGELEGDVPWQSCATAAWTSNVPRHSHWEHWDEHPELLRSDSQSSQGQPCQNKRKQKEKSFFTLDISCGSLRTQH